MPYRAIWPKRRATANMTTNANPSAAKKKLKRKRSATPKTVSVPENTVSIPNFIPKDSSPLQHRPWQAARKDKQNLHQIQPQQNRFFRADCPHHSQISSPHLHGILYRIIQIEQRRKKIVPPNTYRNSVTYLPTSQRIPHYLEIWTIWINTIGLVHANKFQLNSV